LFRKVKIASLIRFLSGQPESESALCGYLANRLGTIVIAPDYWKAPQYPYPFALRQVHAILQSIASGGLELLPEWNYPTTSVDPTQFFLSGASAGANLAAALCTYVLENPLNHGAKILSQALLYPSLELAIPRKEKEEKMRTKPDNRHFPHWMGNLFYRSYLPPPASPRDPLVSPVYISDDVARQQPPTVIVTAELDFLIQDGERYAAKLKDAGVEVVYATIKGAPHGFDLIPAYSKEKVACYFPFCTVTKSTITATSLRQGKRRSI
jgi:acetyl esterase/lipase